MCAGSLLPSTDHVRTAAAIAEAMVLEPLCRETENLIRPVKFFNNEYLSVDLDTDGCDFILQAYAVKENGDHVSASNNASLTWTYRIPERKNLGYGKWHARATDFTALMIAATWPHNRLEFTDDAKIVYDFLLTRFLSQTVAARTRAAFTMRGEEPPLPEGWLDHPTLPLEAHQRVACITTLFSEGSALFMEQGTGKTAIGIRRICHEAAFCSHMYRAIVVCPKNVRSNWESEIFRFATTPGKVVVLRGPLLHRVKQIVEGVTLEPDCQWSVIVCSYDNVKNTWDALKLIEWDLAIADESHFFKSYTAKRTKKMMELRDRARQRMCFTGTFIGNCVSDLCFQLEFLGKGMSGFHNPKVFKSYYIKYANAAGVEGHRIAVDTKNMPILHERLARVSFMITKKEALPYLPDKVFDIIETSMGVEQARYYQELQKHLAVEIEEDLARASETGKLNLTVTNVLVKLLRLAQITSGFIVSNKEYTEDGDLVGGDRSHNHFFSDCPKMDAVVEEIQGKPRTSKTIVWSCWVPVIKELSRRLDAIGMRHCLYYGATPDKERDIIERDFNQDPELRVFIGNPQAGGVGLNLLGHFPDWDDTPKDHGCNVDHVIFYACNWSWLQRSQATDRAHRKGTRVQVRVTDYCVPGTIDEEIRVKVLRKEKLALQVQDVREIMERMLSKDVLGDERD